MTLISAGCADHVVDSLGINVHGTGPYQQWVSVCGAMRQLGLRHVRTGRINIGQAGQRALGAMFASEGITVLPIPDDYGSPTPATRMAEVYNTWGGVVVDGWEGPNEPNNGISSPSLWPDTIPTNGPASTDTTLGKAEVRRQLGLIDVGAALAAPVLGSALSLRNLTGWPVALGDLTSLVAIGSVHCYPGGWQPEHGWQLTEAREESRACYGSLPVWLTETGWHDLLSWTGGHRPTSPLAAATYAARLPFESALAGFSRSYFYSLVDEPALAADYSGHFGAFDSSWSPKPWANAVRYLTGLYADPGEDFSPAPLELEISHDSAVSWALHGKRDGSYLLALWQPGANVWDPTTLAPVTPVTHLISLDGFVAPPMAVVHTPATGQVSTIGLPGAVQVAGDLVVVEFPGQIGVPTDQLLVSASYGRG